jgi:hypothetical protein
MRGEWDMKLPRRYLDSLNQVHDFHSQGIGKQLESLNRDVALAAFDLAHMRPMQPGSLREYVLRHLPLQPQGTNIRPDPLLNVLHSKQCRSTLPKTILVITRDLA